MSSLRIRRARPQDEAAVAALMEQLAAAARGTTASELKDRFLQMLSVNHCALWVAETDDGVVGLVSAHLRPTLHHSGPSGLIDELIVDSRARGQGVGRALVEAVVTWAVTQGASEVEVSTEKENEAAQAFYRQCGFTTEALLLELELDEQLEV
jgi:ribosomal protein S18 acetylase RimI-like enzyme